METPSEMEAPGTGLPPLAKIRGAAPAYAITSKGGSCGFEILTTYEFLNCFEYI